MKKLVALTFALLCALSLVPALAAAQSADELQRQIDDNNAQIAQLDKEIAQYQTQLNSTTAQKNTLQNKINQLNLQSKQLAAKVSVTQKQISTTQAQIKQLGDGIATKQSTIESDQAGLAESLRSLQQSEAVPLVVTVLGADSIAQAWQDADRIGSLQSAVHDDISRLAQEKQSLTDTKTQAEAKQKQLLAQQQELKVQQGSLNATKSAQNELLAETKNKESNYQAIIQQKQAAKADFEATINALQAKLKAADTSDIPTAGSSVLQWPLKSVRITQYFGNTTFAQSGAYNGKGHNGIDLAASIGTPVYAAASGTVWDTNYGIAPACQYGKWILIKHGNGLATLYAHLSGIQVTPGQSVSAGTLIGYSGDTGYATGPHLHFTVYVQSSVSFINYKCNSGPTVRVPVAPFNGYLNPISYLP